MSEYEWLLFTAQLPATPSSLRVNVWRKLKEVGAVKMQNGVWVLPRNASTSVFMERLLGYIRHNDATGQIFVAHSLDKGGYDEILAHFWDERNEEYAEFLEQTGLFLSEIRKETELNKFTFAELEENEQNLKRMKHWLREIVKRDFFQASLMREAQLSLQECVEKLHGYARKVYEREGVGLTSDDDSLLDEMLISNGHPRIDSPE